LNNRTKAVRIFRVYLFSDDASAEPLWFKDFNARDVQDADVLASKLVNGVLHKFDDAEDWVVEEQYGHQAEPQRRNRH